MSSDVRRPLQQLCSILKAIANIEKPTSDNSSSRPPPLINAAEAEELAIGIAQLVDSKNVDSAELARQVDSNFTCFVCRKRCRTKSRFFSHFRSHFRTSSLNRKRQLSKRDDEELSAASSSTTMSSDDMSGSDEDDVTEKSKHEPLHLRGLPNEISRQKSQFRHNRRRLKRNSALKLSTSVIRSKGEHLQHQHEAGVAAAAAADGDGGDSGCHSIDDEDASSAFSDCPGDSESSDSEAASSLIDDKAGHSKLISSNSSIVTVKDRLSLAEKQLDNNETEGLICLTCLKRFSNCQNLRRHLRLHIARDSVTPDFEASLHCDAADDANFDGRYFCDWCPARFENRSAARVHEETHRGQETKCFICDKSYADRYSLRYHLRTHGIGRQIRCEYCNKSFSKPSRLEAHVKAQHDNIRDFECKECGKKFKTRVHLRNHARRHSGERPFSCHLCNNNFRHKASLVAHLRSHVGSRPYCCEVCGKTFREPSTLKAHCRVHTGDKPYHCDICNKSFTQRAGLNYHKRTHEVTSSSGVSAMATSMPLPSPPIQSGDAVFNRNNNGNNNNNKLSPLPSFDHLKSSSSSPSSSPATSTRSDTFSFSAGSHHDFARDVTPPQTPPSSTPPLATVSSATSTLTESGNSNVDDFALASIDEEESNGDLLPSMNLSEIGHQLDQYGSGASGYYGKCYGVEPQPFRQQQQQPHQVCHHQQQLLQQHQHQHWFHSFQLQQQQQQQQHQHHDLQQHSSSYATGSSSYDYTGNGYNNFPQQSGASYPMHGDGLHHQTHLTQQQQQHQQHQQHHMDHFSMFSNNNAYHAGAGGSNGGYGLHGPESASSLARTSAASTSSLHPSVGYCL